MMAPAALDGAVVERDGGEVEGARDRGAAGPGDRHGGDLVGERGGRRRAVDDAPGHERAVLGLAGPFEVGDGDAAEGAGGDGADEIRVAERLQGSRRAGPRTRPGPWSVRHRPPARSRRRPRRALTGRRLGMAGRTRGREESRERAGGTCGGLPLLLYGIWGRSLARNCRRASPRFRQLFGGEAAGVVGVGVPVGTVFVGGLVAQTVQPLRRPRPKSSR